MQPHSQRTAQPRTAHPFCSRRAYELHQSWAGVSHNLEANSLWVLLMPTGEAIDDAQSGLTRHVTPGTTTESIAEVFISAFSRYDTAADAR